MTILEALQARFSGYPMTPAFYQMILIGAGLDGADEFTQEINDSCDFNMAWAEGLFQLLTQPKSVTEGDYSVSSGDADSLWKLINWIRAKCGLEPIGVPTVKFLSDWC